MRLVCCRFAAVLPILTFCSVLALAQGTTPSQTYLAPSTGSAGQIGFSVQVRPGASVQPPFTTPAGTVTLYNGATAVGSSAGLIAESGITSATFAEAFGAPDASVAKAASGAVWGDFNEDGLPDLLVYGVSSGSQPGLVVQDFLCSATSLQNGTTPPFTVLAMQQLALPLQTQSGQTLTVLDVDGDGHLDLLAGSTVAYGKGDGTFGRVAVLPALASGYSQTYAVDTDGDGKTDIVAVDTPPAVSAPGAVQYAFTVLHNAGGGNFSLLGPFQLAPPFAAGASVAYNIFGLSFADVNGDGRMDVLSQSNAVPLGNTAEPARLNVMLNLGTGFGAPQPIDTSAIPDEGIVSIAFADLNGNGKQDLVFSYQANTGNNGVATLLGNGDGTFAAPVNFTIGNTLTIGSPLLPLVTEDVNTDGKADVALGSGALLLGNGHGTLTAGTPLFTSTVTPGNPPPTYAVLTEPPTSTLPGGRTAPLSVLFFINLQSGANAVFEPNLGSSATATAMLAPGTYSLTAHYSGDATYAASVSNTIDVTIAPLAITLTSSASTIYATQPVTFTATLSDSTIAGSITFVDISKINDNPLDPMAGTAETTLGTGAIASGVATLTTKLPVGGTHTILAVYGPDIEAPIAQTQLTETVNLPFAMQSSGAGFSLTASPGQSSTVTIPVHALGGFIGPVTFACVDNEPTCSFSPASVNFSGMSTANVTLTVTATSASTNAAASPLREVALAYCCMPLFVLLGFACGGRRRVLFLVFALALGVAPLTGCGSGSRNSGGSSTPANSLQAGSYPFYITATSGENVQVLNGILTVR